MNYSLNAIREICTRCPLVMNADLLQDLARYKQYRERSVMMAARSLIGLYRSTVPELLHKKDRGRPTEASIALEVRRYGQVSASNFVPGAEILLDDKPSKTTSISEIDTEDNVSKDMCNRVQFLYFTERRLQPKTFSLQDSDGEWIDVSHSSDEGNYDNDDVDNDEEEEDSDDNDSGENEIDENRAAEGNEGSLTDIKANAKHEKEISEKLDNNESQVKMEKHEDDNIDTEAVRNVKNKKRKAKLRAMKKVERKKLKMRKQEGSKLERTEAVTEEKKEKASLISVERLLTDEDFVKIDMALAKQQVTYAKRGEKRPHPNDREHGEFVKLTDIENIYKKRKHDKQARIESVKVRTNFLRRHTISNFIDHLILVIVVITVVFYMKPDRTS